MVDGETGTFFDRPTVDDLAGGIERLDSMTFDPAAIRANAERFRPEVFRPRFIELLTRLGVDPSLYASA